jgi:hypothetical protein
MTKMTKRKMAISLRIFQVGSGHYPHLNLEVR